MGCATSLVRCDVGRLHSRIDDLIATGTYTAPELHISICADFCDVGLSGLPSGTSILAEFMFKYVKAHSKSKSSSKQQINDRKLVANQTGKANTT